MSKHESQQENRKAYGTELCQERSYPSQFNPVELQ